jgi:hypothetical protein
MPLGNIPHPACARKPDAGPFSGLVHSITKYVIGFLTVYFRYLKNKANEKIDG